MGDLRQSKVVLDRVFFDTFLSMAVQEGLLQEDLGKGDRYLSRYETYSAPRQLKEKVLEQVVLTPEVLTIQHLPLDHFSGPIIEENSLVQVEPPTEDLVTIGHFSKRIIGAMLASRGYTIPEDEFEERLTRARETLDEAEAYTKRTGKEPPSLLTWWFQEILRKKWGWTFEGKYTPEEYKAEERRQEAYKAAKPILDCMVEYVQLATVASRENALMRIPTGFLPSEVGEDELLQIDKCETEDIALLRVVAKQLGKLTFRDTLIESLELARHPNTAALREKLAEWKDRLASADIDKLEIIQSEVKEATSELARLSTVENIGRVTTYLSVPITVVELLTGLTPVLGIVATVVGVATQIDTDITEKRFRWAMFGNT